MTLYSSKTKDGQNEEVLLGLDRKAYTVRFLEPADGDVTKAKQYCVSNIVGDVIFNDQAMEFFSKLLEKSQGQKI